LILRGVTTIEGLQRFKVMAWLVIQAGIATTAKRTEFETLLLTATVPKRPVNLEGVVNQRVREFWAVWNGHRSKKWHFDTAPRVSSRTRESGVAEENRRKS
jgi:hypothetical protein